MCVCAKTTLQQLQTSTQDSNTLTTSQPRPLDTVSRLPPPPFPSFRVLPSLCTHVAAAGKNTNNSTKIRHLLLPLHEQQNKSRCAHNTLGATIMHVFD